MSEHKNKASQSTIIVGLVHPYGCSAVTRNKLGWVLQFSFHSWRSEDGILHSEKLNLIRPMPRESLQPYMDRIKPYKILNVRIDHKGDHLEAAIGWTSKPTAEFLDLLDDDVKTDDALTQIAMELQKPQTYNDDQFGTFVFNRRLDWYETTTTWAGKDVQLVIAAEDETKLTKGLRVAVELWENQVTWNQRIQDYAVQELLDLKNDSWLDEDQMPVSNDEFKSRMSLESITIYPDSKFVFWHRDGDLFWGHWIKIAGDLENGLSQADIPG